MRGATFIEKKVTSAKHKPAGGIAMPGGLKIAVATVPLGTLLMTCLEIATLCRDACRLHSATA